MGFSACTEACNCGVDCTAGGGAAATVAGTDAATGVAGRTADETAAVAAAGCAGEGVAGACETLATLTSADAIVDSIEAAPVEPPIEEAPPA